MIDIKDTITQTQRKVDILNKYGVDYLHGIDFFDLYKEQEEIEKDIAKLFKEIKDLKELSDVIFRVADDLARSLEEDD